MDAGEILRTVLVLAFIVEALVDTTVLLADTAAKPIRTWVEDDKKRVAGAVIGVLVALGTGADMIAVTAVPFKLAYVGSILTGLFFGRGAQWLMTLLTGLQGAAQRQVLEANMARAEAEYRPQMLRAQAAQITHQATHARAMATSALAQAHREVEGINTVSKPVVGRDAEKNQ